MTTGSFLFAGHTILPFMTAHLPGIVKFCAFTASALKAAVTIQFQDKATWQQSC